MVFITKLTTEDDLKWPLVTSRDPLIIDDPAMTPGGQNIKDFDFGSFENYGGL